MGSPKSLWNSSTGILTIILSCLLISCGTYKPITYTPTTKPSIEESRKTLEQLIRETSSTDSRFQDIQMTETYFKCSYIETQQPSIWSANRGITTVPFSKFVYFNNVFKIDMYDSNPIWYVYVFDKTGVELFSYMANGEDKAKMFIDNLVNLSEKQPQCTFYKYERK